MNKKLKKGPLIILLLIALAAVFFAVKVFTKKDPANKEDPAAEQESDGSGVEELIIDENGEVEIIVPEDMGDGGF